MNGFVACDLYNAIKFHFTTDKYNFFKYNGKSGLKPGTYEKKKDKYFYVKLATKYQKKEELVDFLVSVFSLNYNGWVGGLFDSEIDKIHINRLKKIQSLSYMFENDCRKLFNDINNPNDILRVGSEYPLLLQRYLEQEINIETICILNNVLNFIEMWDNKIQDTIQWPSYKRLIIKYAPFIPMEVNKLRGILTKIL